jgi:TAF6 C-terminal HEAT repeat domain
MLYCDCVIGCEVVNYEALFTREKCHGKSDTLEREKTFSQTYLVVVYCRGDVWDCSNSTIHSIPRFGDKYANLEPRVLHELCLATDAKRPLATRYGGFVALSLFGPRAIASFLLPLATDHWNTWQQTLDETTNLEQRLELQMFQQAILVCILKSLWVVGVTGLHGHYSPFLEISSTRHSHDFFCFPTLGHCVCVSWGHVFCFRMRWVNSWVKALRRLPRH